MYPRSRIRKSRTRKRVFLIIFLIFLLIGGFLFVKAARYFPVFFQLVSQKGVHLKENKQKQVNLLLLGVGGGTHEGPNLTDTIIYANIDPDKKKVTLVSLPRDMWIPSLNAKI